MEYKAFKNLNSQDFIEQIVLSNANALVKIALQWNVAGLILSKTLNEMSTFYCGKIDFFQLDHEGESAVTSAYHVEGVPTSSSSKKEGW